MKEDKKILAPYKEIIRTKDAEKIKKFIRNCGNTIRDFNKEIRGIQNMIDLVTREKMLLEKELQKIQRGKK